jgi:hypothetical protein
VNNSHLQRETTAATVLDSMEYARATAELLGLPLVFTAVPALMAAELAAGAGNAAAVPNIYPVEVYVRTPWDDAVPGGEEV